MSQISNVLVTGGLGFIGSWYAKLLAEEGYYPVIIDKMTYAADINRIKGIEDEIYVGNRLYIGDICDNELCKKIIEDNNIDAIVNFAASTHVDNSIKDSTPFIQNNIVGVHTLLEICKENENNMRFIQVSSDEVYGSTKYDNDVFKETDKLNPGNPYAASKASADLLALSYFNTYNSNIVITRSSNNYGPFQNTEKFIPRMLSLAMEGKNLDIYGNGKNIRDWLYVDDNCQAIKNVMEKGRKGEIYNIGAGNEKTNNEIAKIIAERFNIGIKYVKDRPGHDYRYSINSNKILNELGWNAKTSFEDGIEKTIDFYIKNKGD